MADLSQLSGSEMELLVSLPYRAGMFVSYADDVDGESDDEIEMAMLEASLKAVADMYAGDPVLSGIFKQALLLKSEWPKWQTKVFLIAEDAQAAIMLLKSKAGEGVAKSYRAALMEIATTVAQAAGEFDQFDDVAEAKKGFGALVGKIVGGFSGLSKDDQNHPANISASEQGALFELSEALKV